MKTFGSFKDILLRGLYALIPILICVYLLIGLFENMRSLSESIMMLLPHQYDFVKSFPGLAAILLITILVYVLGILFTKTKVGRGIFQVFENLIPGYQLFKSLLADKVEKTGDNLKPCIVKYDDSWSIGYEVESLDNGMVVVFLPGSPSIASGSVQILKRESIQRLDLSKRDAATCLTQFGIGSAAKLNGRFDSK
ncbi:MAG: hypothetical protein K1X85_03230 [Ignavibacteria bacterium]|nr:hypothetical protein [Ignavibacteria bacterium]